MTEISEALSFTDKACEILQATNDGDDLSPEDLYLLQGAVNDGLSFLGSVAFVNLHQQVITGYKNMASRCRTSYDRS